MLNEKERRITQIGWCYLFYGVSTLFGCLLAKLTDLDFYSETDNLKTFLMLIFFSFLGGVFYQLKLSNGSEGDPDNAHAVLIHALFWTPFYMMFAYPNHNIFGLFIKPLNGDTFITLAMWAGYILLMFVSDCMFQPHFESYDPKDFGKRFLGSVSALAIMVLLYVFCNIWAKNQTWKFEVYDETSPVKYFLLNLSIFLAGIIWKDVKIRNSGLISTIVTILSDLIIAAVFLFFFTNQTVSRRNIFGCGYSDNFFWHVVTITLYYLAYSIVSMIVKIFVVPRAAFETSSPRAAAESS